LPYINRCTPDGSALLEKLSQVSGLVRVAERGWSEWQIGAGQSGRAGPARAIRADMASQGGQSGQGKCMHACGHACGRASYVSVHLYASAVPCKQWTCGPSETRALSGMALCLTLPSYPPPMMAHVCRLHTAPTTPTTRHARL
jgi:hypothetical protein